MDIELELYIPLRPDDQREESAGLPKSKSEILECARLFKFPSIFLSGPSNRDPKETTLSMPATIAAMYNTPTTIAVFLFEFILITFFFESTPQNYN